MPSFRETIARALPELVAIRHDLHQHPELAYQEHRTAGVVTKQLDALGIRYIAGLAGGTGVVAHLPATEPVALDQTAAGAIGLRADMDALPINEQTGLPYASQTQGLMHACGHDGHTTILLGAARVLAQARRPRPVTLVFQPAEEGGGGGSKLCEEGLMSGKIIGPAIDHMYGLHCWPELPQGTVGTRPGPLLAATNDLHIIIRGRQSHAAFPQYSRDPVLCSAYVLTALQQLTSRNVGPLDSVVCSVCMIKGGSAHNVIPDKVEMIGTIRTLDPVIRELAKVRAREIIEHTALACGCSAEVSIEDGYPVTFNDPALTEKWFAKAASVVGADKVVRIERPVMGGEDFSYYAREKPSVFYCLGLMKPGQTSHPTLHQPDFDFNDAALPTGIELMCELATAQ